MSTTNPERDLVAVYPSYFEEDYSEAALEPIVYKMLDGVFGESK